MEQKNINKITSVDIKNLAEGTRLSYTYSVLDENGKITDFEIEE